jgi:hypothetical protein
MRGCTKPVTDGKQPAGAAHPTQLKKEKLMKSIVLSVIAILLLTSLAAAKDPLPDAPRAIASGEAMVTVTPAPAIASLHVESKTVDLKFASLALISTGSTFADSYTTLFARQNWLAGKAGVCNAEVESAYLYGTHPTVGRVYAVAAGKSAVSVFAAYYLRKHHSKFWSLPLVANSAISLQGVSQNLRACN